MTDVSPPATDPGDVAGAFLDGVEHWLGIDRSATAPALRSALLQRLRLAQRAEPSHGLVHQLAARALEVADAGVGREDTAADLRMHLARSCHAEREDLLAARAATARTAADLVTGRDAWLATLGGHLLVRAAMLETVARDRAPRALVAEGRPMLAGRGLAAALAAAGVPTWLVVDGALPLLLSQATLVWIGAHAVTERGVIAPIGSYAAALAAREHSVAVYALAHRRMFLPATTGALTIVEMSPDEVWKNPPAGVQPRNVHLEVVPLDTLRGVAVEDEVLGPMEAAAVARERKLPDELAGVQG